MTQIRQIVTDFDFLNTDNQRIFNFLSGLISFISVISVLISGTQMTQIGRMITDLFLSLSEAAVADPV